jgi:hypothetical protein
MEKEQNNDSVPNFATGNNVADNQGVAADISARDEYDPNWSNRQKNMADALRSTKAHKALEIALHNVIQETVSTITGKGFIANEVNKAMDSYAFDDWITSALDNYDFDNIVSETIDNYNFDEIVAEVMEDRFGELFEQHVKRLSLFCER